MVDPSSEPIPWVYSDSPGVLMWTWLTEHFIARVTGTEVDGLEDRRIRSYAWDLSDLMRTSQGMPRLLINGMSASFEDADALIREHVGKCYDPRLGYQAYAGKHAFTFALASGIQADVRDMIGTRCTVTVLLPDRSHEVVVGDLSVHNYKWRLRDGEQILEVTPEHVVSIVNRSAAAQRATEVVDAVSYSGIGRIYRSERTTGCTGTPGYMVGTVDHAGVSRCPVHEASVREDLLR
ncbi:MAG: hypothetical protein F2840_01150 [Actinobacteria bacterium]|uniref:Unannotated protein n=1 Tax=freshwater metagenome TaxID=449393 RepID=A0A6J7IHS5_9ZZZZ|nr:hypothetical protein [Actinomycetota bacterium]